MTQSLVLQNLFAHWLQVLALVAASGLAVGLLRVRSPRLLLGFWHVLLLGSLLLPLLQPWREVSDPSDGALAAISLDASQAPGSPSQQQAASAPIDWASWALGLVALGISIRLLWIGLGLLRLRSYRLHSAPIRVPRAILRLRRRLGVDCEFRISDRIPGAATYGFSLHTILLPRAFEGMPEQHRIGILAHELFHIRRRDWLTALGEELVKALLWFQPACWWLVKRIHVAREQRVDRLVVAELGDRRQYVESILRAAEAQLGASLVPAPSFMSSRHLRERVTSLLQEAPVTRTRLILSSLVLSLVLICGHHLVLNAFPLKAPQEGLQRLPSQAVEVTSVRQHPSSGHPLRVGSNVAASKLLSREDPVYPPLAKKARVEGAVFLQVTVDEEGTVSAVNPIRGHPLLTEAAVRAVGNWRYAPTYHQGVAIPVQFTVTVDFNLGGGDASSLPPPPPPPRPRVLVDREGRFLLDGRVVSPQQIQEALGADSRVLVRAEDPEVPEQVFLEAARRLKDARLVATLMVPGKPLRMYTDAFDPDHLRSSGRSSVTLIVGSDEADLDQRLKSDPQALRYRVALGRRHEVLYVEKLGGPDLSYGEDLVRAHVQLYIEDQLSRFDLRDTSGKPIDRFGSELLVGLVLR